MKRLQQIFKEDLNPDLTNKDNDKEGRMVKKQLMQIIKQAQSLHDQLENDAKLEAWVQAKITKANDYLETVFSHLDNYPMEEQLAPLYFSNDDEHFIATNDSVDGPYVNPMGTPVDKKKASLYTPEED